KNIKELALQKKRTEDTRFQDYYQNIIPSMIQPGQYVTTPNTRAFATKALQEEMKQANPNPSIVKILTPFANGSNANFDATKTTEQARSLLTELSQLPQGAQNTQMMSKVRQIVGGKLGVD